MIKFECNNRHQFLMDDSYEKQDLICPVCNEYASVITQGKLSEETIMELGCLNPDGINNTKLNLKESMSQPQKGLLLLQNKVEYLKDTIGILVNYDNENNVEGLKALIDETRTRLDKILNGEVSDEDLGMTEEQFNEKLKY